MLCLCVCLSVLVCVAQAQFEGESCASNGAPGLCRRVQSCQSAIEQIKRRQMPKICSFLGTDPIVCCVESNPAPVATTTKRTITTTTEYVPPVYDYVETHGGAPAPACEPLSPKLTAAKTGKKAWDKCIEYQHNLVYPCTKGVALVGGLTRQTRCHHEVADLIVGGVNAAADEFPHMALLGFGNDPQSAAWSCGGTLLSERFILTAGHCTYSREAGAVTFALLGVLKRSDQFNRDNLYSIKQIIKNPKYDPPRRYNDIALLKTDRDVTLSEYIVPACLDVGATNNYESAWATGWGATLNRGSSADQLQKVKLTKFTDSECGDLFGPDRLMKNGFDANTQICYGDKNKSKDTCQGDSGGPIQLQNRQIICMYTVVGVTSFGRACGVIGEPGIYTRVAAFVPWIESIVWP